MVAILDDRESEVELGRQGFRGFNRICACRYDLATRGLDRRELVLQLDELPLAGPSTTALVEVHDDL
jgi:hypothetical protein